jgi:anti-sigma B factor antagonist
MKHEIRESGGHTVVAFEGDVDLDSSPAARKVLLECVKLRRSIVVDMSEVSYIDSSGVASLVESLQAARKAGLGFALVTVSESAMRVLQLARLDQVFPIHASLDEALGG